MSREHRILIVDDDAIMRAFIGSLLAEQGYWHVEQAEDGDTALAMMRADHFDLLLTDWNMPGMSGLELLKAVRADPALVHVPVLIVTSETQRTRIEEAARCGVTGYIMKPSLARTLGDKVDLILRRPADARQD